MNIHVIRNDEDHAAALGMIERFWDAPDGSKEADALEVLAVLVDDYENARWPIEALDPVETLKAHMVATGRNQADLAQLVGSRSRASEVIARKRALTLGMIRNLESEWNLPATLLIAAYDLKSPPKASKNGAQNAARKKRSARVPARRRVAA
jgi:antitoxin component HigA of HigAB toxin-antitoxin module